MTPSPTHTPPTDKERAKKAIETFITREPSLAGWKVTRSQSLGVQFCGISCGLYCVAYLTHKKYPEAFLKPTTLTPHQTRLLHQIGANPDIPGNEGASTGEELEAAEAEGEVDNLNERRDLYAFFGAVELNEGRLRIKK